MDVKLEGQEESVINGSPQRLKRLPTAEDFFSQLSPPGSPRTSRAGSPKTFKPAASQPKPTPKPRSSGISASSSQQPQNSQSQKRRTESVEPAGAEPPPKRPRPGKAKTDALLRCQRNEQYWHLDGSVIVKVESSLFKLHRSVLARSSPYFERLFDDMPDGNVSTNNAAYIDLPVFKLTGAGESVTVEDFEKLMWAVENAIVLFLDPQPFSVLAAVLRAANKLEFTGQRRWAVKVLEDMWPRDLAAFRADPSPRPHAAESVLLANECNVPRVRRRAFYELLRTTAFGQLPSSAAPVQRPDAAAVAVATAPKENRIQAGEQGAEVAGANPDAVPELSLEDVLMLVSTREKLAAAWLDTVLQYRCVPQCPFYRRQPLGCEIVRETIAHWSEDVFASGLFANGLVDPVLGVGRLITLPSRARYNEVCIAKNKERWAKVQQQWWESIDEWMELGLKISNVY